MSEAEGLDVYLHGAIAGTLERRSRARLRFTYAGEWVAGEGAPLSLSLPVRSEPFEHDECAPFFEGLLPRGGLPQSDCPHSPRLRDQSLPAAHRAGR